MAHSLWTNTGHCDGCIPSGQRGQLVSGFTSTSSLRLNLNSAPQNRKSLAPAPSLGEAFPPFPGAGFGCIAPAPGLHFAVVMLNDDTEAEVLQRVSAEPVTGGESRTGQLTGTKALMMAVLEDGIRCYLGGARLIAQEAEFWIFSTPPRLRSPFSFVVICEVLGLDPSAVRVTLKRMKKDNLAPRKAIPRTRHNVRIPGRVCLRKAG